MPLDRRHLLRNLVSSAALVGLGGSRSLGSLWREVHGAGDDRHEPLDGFEPSGSADGRSRPRQARRPFEMVAARTPPGVELAVRVSQDGEDFGSWLPLYPNDVEREGPDGAEARAAGNAWMRMTTPAWTGPARWVQLHVAGARPDEVELLTRTTAERDADAALAAQVRPAGGGLRIVRRHEWGADESIRRAGASYAERVLHGVVHHTAGTNDYRPEDGPRIVRGIYEFHVRGNGWRDIGYNLLIDKYGVVYEGRYGGLDLPVIGAHASGVNTGSFGVALLGDFRWQEVSWPEPRNTLFEVLLWKFGLHAIAPRETVTAFNGREDVPTLSGHRDVGSTECPGDRLHVLLEDWRDGLERRLPGPLTDIEGHPHEAAIRSIRQAGITGGYADGTFRPDQPVTRGQMATFLTRAAQLQPGEGVPFTDVGADDPHRDGIAAVAAADIAAGREDGTFGPTDAVTRGQMATFLARATELEPRPDGATFPDVPPDHPHHGTIEAVAAASVALGFEDGTFRPGQEVTRGQMAAFLARAFELPAAGDGPQDADDLDPDDDPDEVDDDEHLPGDEVDPGDDTGGGTADPAATSA